MHGEDCDCFLFVRFGHPHDVHMFGHRRIGGHALVEIGLGCSADDHHACCARLPGRRCAIAVQKRFLNVPGGLGKIRTAKSTEETVNIRQE